MLKTIGECVLSHRHYSGQRAKCGLHPHGRTKMNVRTLLATAAMALILIASTACSVTRGQQTVGEYVDDAAITTAVKARLLEDSDVGGLSITVETMDGEVLLSGFARTSNEKYTAERIALRVNGVRSVRNGIVVRP
jgi:hyperosmotically inducible periplasmic protein